MWSQLLACMRTHMRTHTHTHTVCLGTLAFGDNWSAMMAPMTKAQVETILDAYVARGGNFVDTALNYQDGQSVKWLGEWMEKRGCRERLVVAAKYSMPLHKGDINSGGNHRKSLRSALKATLHALRTDYIVCAPNPSLPLFLSLIHYLPRATAACRLEHRTFCMCTCGTL